MIIHARLALALMVAAIPSPASTQDWHTGSSTIDWADGFSCVPAGKCFEVLQRGVGIPLPVFGTKDCWRKQVWVTRITNVPDGNTTHRVVDQGGFWQVGVMSVVISGSVATIETFVIQDHGGLESYCLSPGEGRFVISIAPPEETPLATK